MIISDLNYVEAVAEAAEVHGGVTQAVVIGQFGLAAAGNGKGVNVGNTAVQLNIAIPTLTAIKVLSN